MKNELKKLRVVNAEPGARTLHDAFVLELRAEFSSSLMLYLRTIAQECSKNPPKLVGS